MLASFLFIRMARVCLTFILTGNSDPGGWFFNSFINHWTLIRILYNFSMIGSMWLGIRRRSERNNLRVDLFLWRVVAVLCDLFIYMILECGVVGGKLLIPRAGPRGSLFSLLLLLLSLLEHSNGFSIYLQLSFRNSIPLRISYRSSSFPWSTPLVCTVFHVKLWITSYNIKYPLWQQEQSDVDGICNGTGGHSVCACAHRVISPSGFQSIFCPGA